MEVKRKELNGVQIQAYVLKRKEKINKNKTKTKNKTKNIKVITHNATSFLHISSKYFSAEINVFYEEINLNQNSENEFGTYKTYF